MLIAENRPRNLDWRHAGPLLFGDWGTSRLYVLGLAFFFTAHASVYYLAVMGVIMGLVAWAYTIVCRSFPEGGGVYTSARQISPLLSVVGATLLLCDYIITASLSTLEAFHYFGVGHEYVVICSMATIITLGLVNWFGAKSAGRLALLIALMAMFVSLSIAAISWPYIKEGFRTLSWEGVAQSSNWQRWESLVRIMLALSGVEAVSNMTGIMKQPVARTAKRTIWPVFAEVCLFNIIFGLAIAGLPALRDIHQPDFATHVLHAPDGGSVPEEVREYRDTAMRVLSIEASVNAFGPAIGAWLGRIPAFVFGLLLLSASSTVMVGMISVLYNMSRDRELPIGFSRLNYSGVPWWGVLFACAAPCVVLLFVHDVMLLADLYAVGVVGAIAINISCCVFNRSLDIRRWQRITLAGIAALMIAVEATIVITKPHAAAFAGGMVAVVLIARFCIRIYAPPPSVPVPEPQIGWLAELRNAPIRLDADKPRIMLAARGRDQAEYAVNAARKRGAVLFTIFVRTLRIQDIGTPNIPKIDDDPEAQAALGAVAVLCRESNVPFFPIYVTAEDIANEILDYTVTYACDTLILGKSRRSPFARRIVGDVAAKITQNLPDSIELITRAGRWTPRESAVTSSNNQKTTDHNSSNA